MKILVSEDLWNFDLEQALQQISAQRREQALKFKFELGQRQCVLSYLLLKQLLAEVFGYRENPVFEFGEHGKPAIVGHPEMFFNMSHCREAVACVVAHQAVGIDVEAVREYTPSLLNYVMSADEQAQIAAAERQDLAFISLWTKKEAVLKLTGEGLRDNVRTVLEECTMQNAECTMQNAECRMQNAQCRMQNAQCRMQNAQCSLPPSARTNAMSILWRIGKKMEEGRCEMRDARC